MIGAIGALFAELRSYTSICYTDGVTKNSDHQHALTTSSFFFVATRGGSRRGDSKSDSKQFAKLVKGSQALRGLFVARSWSRLDYFVAVFGNSLKNLMCSFVSLTSLVDSRCSGFTAQRSESCIGTMVDFLAPFAAWAAGLGTGTTPLNMAGVVKGAVGTAIQASGLFAAMRSADAGASADRASYPEGSTNAASTEILDAFIKYIKNSLLAPGREVWGLRAAGEVCFDCQVRTLPEATLKEQALPEAKSGLGDHDRLVYTSQKLV